MIVTEKANVAVKVAAEEEEAVTEDMVTEETETEEEDKITYEQF